MAQLKLVQIDSRANLESPEVKELIFAEMEASKMPDSFFEEYVFAQVEGEEPMEMDMDEYYEN